MILRAAVAQVETSWEDGPALLREFFRILPHAPDWEFAAEDVTWLVNLRGGNYALVLGPDVPRVMLPPRFQGLPRVVGAVYVMKTLFEGPEPERGWPWKISTSVYPG